MLRVLYVCALCACALCVCILCVCALFSLFHSLSLSLSSPTEPHFLTVNKTSLSLSLSLPLSPARPLISAHHFLSLSSLLLNLVLLVVSVLVQAQINHHSSLTTLASHLDDGLLRQTTLSFRQVAINGNYSRIIFTPSGSLLHPQEV